MSDTKLLPCPFCGANVCEICFDDEDTGPDGGRRARVECSESETCFANTGWQDDLDTAIAAWNTRPAPALAPKQAAADTPEQMRERCFHDFLRLIQACMRFMDQEEEGVLQRFRGLVEKHGIPGLGTGTCDCGADDCPYKTASVPCDCGLPDCSDPRIAAADKMAKALEAAETFIAEELACRRQSFEPDPQEHEKSYMGEAEQALSAVRAALAKAGRP